MLLVKGQPHLLTRLFVRLIAALFLLSGVVFFVIGMEQFALGRGYWETLVQGFLLNLSGFLLVRLRARGIKIFGILVIFSYIQVFLGEELYFWLHFLFASVLLLLLCLLSLSYFSLLRAEGRRPRQSARFFIAALYIALTGSGLTVYYGETLCTNRSVLEFDIFRREPLHVSLITPLAQWLSGVSCPAGGDLSFERNSLPQPSPRKASL